MKYEREKHMEEINCAFGDKKDTGDDKPENTWGGGRARPNAKLWGGSSIANIYRVGGYVNHSGKREDQ